MSFCDGKLSITPTFLWSDEQIKRLIGGTYTGEPEEATYIDIG